MTRKEIVKRVEIIRDRYLFDGKVPKFSPDECFLVELFRFYPELEYLKNGMRFCRIEVEKCPLKGTAFFLIREDLERKHIKWRDCISGMARAAKRNIELLPPGEGHTLFHKRYEQLELLHNNSIKA